MRASRIAARHSSIDASSELDVQFVHGVDGVGETESFPCDLM